MHENIETHWNCISWLKRRVHLRAIYNGSSKSTWVGRPTLFTSMFDSTTGGVFCQKPA
jgi:hypothetical protein